MRKLISSFAIVGLLALCGTASASEYEVKQAVPSAVLVGTAVAAHGAMYAGLSGILIGSIIYCQSMMKKDASGTVIYQDPLCSGSDKVFVGSTTPNPYIPTARP